jgi:hypothetical protein
LTRSFLHPEESGDAKFVAHLMSGAMAERDGDDDHRLSMEEFENGLWHELKPWNPSKYDSYGIHDYEVCAFARLSLCSHQASSSTHSTSDIWCPLCC